MDTTVMLGSLKFSLRATRDHHGPSIHSGHYTASINCGKKNFYCNDNTITEFEIIDSKHSSTAYVILYELVDMSFGLEQEGGSLITPMALTHHPHSIDSRSILEIDFTQQLGCIVGLASWIVFLCFCILTCPIVHFLIHHIIFRLYL